MAKTILSSPIIIEIKVGAEGGKTAKAKATQGKFAVIGFFANRFEYGDKLPNGNIAGGGGLAAAWGGWTTSWQLNTNLSPTFREKDEPKCAAAIRAIAEGGFSIGIATEKFDTEDEAKSWLITKGDGANFSSACDERTIIVGIL